MGIAVELIPSIISVDPGNSTGWAKFKQGSLWSMNMTKGLEECFNFLRTLQADIFVVEDFRIQPGKNLSWNNLIAPRVIGAIEYHAHRLGAQLVKQQPSIKPAAYGLSGYNYRKGAKDAHIVDAIAHGNYYILKNYGRVVAEEA